MNVVGLSVPSSLPLFHGFRRSVLQSVHHKHLQQLLIADTHLHRVGAGTVLAVPATGGTTWLRTRLHAHIPLSGHPHTHLSHHTIVTMYLLPSPPLQPPSPCLDKRHVHCSPGPARAKVERSRGPQECDPVGCVVCVEWCGGEEGLHPIRENKVLVFLRLRVIHLTRQGAQTDVLTDRQEIKHAGRQEEEDNQ